MKFHGSAVIGLLICSLQLAPTALCAGSSASVRSDSLKSGVTAYSSDSTGSVRQAIDAYRAKRFHAAEDLLNDAIALDPTNQQAHLWLGKTLEMLLDPKAAKAEYENCYKINPFTPDGINARKLSMDVAGRVAGEAAAPLDDVKTVTKTTQIINQQANDLKGRWLNWGQNGANWQMQKYQNTYNAGRYNNAYNPYGGAGGYNGGYNPYGGAGGYNGGYNPNGSAGGYGGAGGPGGQGGYGGGYNGFGPNANWGNGNYGYANPFGRNNTVSNMNQIQQSYLRSDTQVQAYRYRTTGTQAAAYAQESANNLETLLAEKARPGEAKLRALGTNLYIRNYGSKANDGNVLSTPPEDPVEQLRATAKRLADVAPSALRAQPPTPAPEPSETTALKATPQAPIP